MKINEMMTRNVQAGAAQQSIRDGATGTLATTRA